MEKPISLERPIMLGKAEGEEEKEGLRVGWEILGVEIRHLSKWQSLRKAGLGDLLMSRLKKMGTWCSFRKNRIE